MSRFNTFCAVALLIFNISSSMYVKRLITKFHKNPNDLPAWARIAREAIEKLDGSVKELLPDLVDNRVAEEEAAIQNKVDLAFLNSELFAGFKNMRLDITERGFDMRDEFELKRDKSKADGDVNDALIEMVEVKEEEKITGEFSKDYNRAKAKAQEKK